jgi:hypothetical protein
MIEKVIAMFEGIPRIAIFAVLILAVIGAVWFWRRWTGVDKETEIIKANHAAAQYADMIAKRLPAEIEDAEDTSDAEDAEFAVANVPAVSKDYASHVLDDQEITTDDQEFDDEEYEPMN